MDYLQYKEDYNLINNQNIWSFKPYYKWITFNTVEFSIKGNYTNEF